MRRSTTGAHPFSTMGACIRCQPASRPVVSRRSRRVPWHSGSPASNGCPSHRARTRPRDRWCTVCSSCCSPIRLAARTIEHGTRCFHQAVDEYATDPEFTLLAPRRRSAAGVRRRCLVTGRGVLPRWKTRRRSARSASSCGSRHRSAHLALRGIIDRLELDADGELVVTDYKTGRAPGLKYEQRRLAGVHFYSFLCEEVLGVRPSAIRLMYLTHRRDHHRPAVGAVGQVHHHPHDRGVEGGRAGLPHRQLPAAPGPAVRSRARSSSGARRSAATPNWPPSKHLCDTPPSSREGGRVVRPLGRRQLERLRGNRGRRHGLQGRQHPRRLQWDLARHRHRASDRRSVGSASIADHVGTDRRREPHRQPRHETTVPANTTDRDGRPPVPAATTDDVELSQRARVGCVLRRGDPDHGNRPRPRPGVVLHGHHRRCQPRIRAHPLSVRRRRRCGGRRRCWASSVRGSSRRSSEGSRLPRPALRSRSSSQVTVKTSQVQAGIADNELCL